MKDLIIGCYTDYNWDKIKYWVNSIEQSGFTGDKVMIVFNSDYETVNKLIERNFLIYAFKKDDNLQQFYYPGKFSIVVERFFHIWNYLNNLKPDQKYRYVITTDVKDVVFQSNPSNWLTENFKDKQLLVSAESIQYQHEPWGANNMQLSFPMMWNHMKDKPIWNCGVLAGEPSAIRDLALNIYLICRGIIQEVPGGGGPDQAALNILLQSDAYKNITQFAKSEDGWACQAGTTANPKLLSFIASNLLEPSPSWNNTDVTTNTGELYPILHQWDRIPQWKSALEFKYG